MTATQCMNGLVRFAQEKGLIDPEDAPWALNRLLEAMDMDAPQEGEGDDGRVRETATDLLEGLCADAASRGVIEDTLEERDLFSARLMGAVTPSPFETRERFFRLMKENGPQAATQWFYGMCRSADYVKVDRVSRNVRFFEDSPAGRLEITINLSKPEKDPRDIARARTMKQAGYPKCMLCRENPGYRGRSGFPARQNHRMIPLTLTGSRWYLQYSPYLYYNEHCIVLNSEHRPMQLSRGSFERLFEFVGMFPHYFLGSNADLPIVGGSILTHDHFQGGAWRFPMDDAPVRRALVSPVEGVDAWIADWPMSCLRLLSDDPEKLIGMGETLLNAWRQWSDPLLGIFAETDGTPHNTVTPIVRREGGRWKLDVVLRNNRTSDERPLGIFHPAPELHHIKKENIGLIEVMGLFILPGRLKEELKGLEAFLTGERDISARPDAADPLEKHWDWIRAVAARTGTSLTREQAERELKRELAKVCAQVLADAGVYKAGEEGLRGMLRFLASIGYAPRG